MKVILKQDVAKVGKKGELIEVSDGYGRNFLVGRGLADEATPGKVREYQEHQKTQKAKDDKRQKAAVAEALGAQFGCSVDKKDIKLDDSIKQAGSFAFKIKLYPGIDAEMTLKVETE